MPRVYWPAGREDSGALRLAGSHHVSGSTHSFRKEQYCAVAVQQHQASSSSGFDDLEILNHQRQLGMTLVLRADTDSPRGSLRMVEAGRFTG